MICKTDVPNILQAPQAHRGMQHTDNQQLSAPHFLLSKGTHKKGDQMTSKYHDQVVMVGDTDRSQMFDANTACLGERIAFRFTTILLWGKELKQKWNQLFWNLVIKTLHGHVGTNIVQPLFGPYLMNVLITLSCLDWFHVQCIYPHLRHMLLSCITFDFWLDHQPNWLESRPCSYW